MKLVGVFQDFFRRMLEVVVPPVLIESLICRSNLRLRLAFFHDRREDSEIMALQNCKDLISDFLLVRRAMKEITYWSLLPRESLSQIEQLLADFYAIHGNRADDIVFTSTSILFEHEAARFISE